MNGQDPKSTLPRSLLTAVSRRCALLGLVSTCALLAACSSKTISPEMQAVAESYFTAIAAGNVDGALALYGEEFYGQTSRDQWSQILRRVSEKLGPMQEHKLLGWRVQSRVGTGAGVFLELTYDVQYEKYAAQEFIVVARTLTGDEPRILSHHINSAGLLLE